MFKTKEYSIKSVGRVYCLKDNVQNKGVTGFVCVERSVVGQEMKMRHGKR